MGVRLHAEIDFFGLNSGEAHGLVALLKQRGIDARVDEHPSTLVSGRDKALQTALKISRVGVIAPAENEKAAQQKLWDVYLWLNANGPDYEVNKIRIFDGDAYHEVI